MIKKDSAVPLHHSSGPLSAKKHISLYSEIVGSDTVGKPLGLLTEDEYSAPRTEASEHQIKCNLKKSLSFWSHLHLSPPEVPSQLWKMTWPLQSAYRNFISLYEKANGCSQLELQGQELGPVTYNSHTTTE